jgi:hypothetical protein
MFINDPFMILTYPYNALHTATGSTGPNKISDIFSCGSSVAQFQTIPEENAKAAAACSNLQQGRAALLFTLKTSL